MRTISRHSTFYDLLEALGQPGCAICTLVVRTRWRYLDNLAYENVNDPGVRARLRDSLGFCNRHAWYFVETVREVFGAAIIYRDLLHTIQRATAGASGEYGLTATGPCPACAAERQSADAALLVLAEALDESDLRSALDRSDGLCGPHLLRATTLVPPDRRPGLLTALLSTWERGGEETKRERWCATGAAGLFPTDDLALASAADGVPVTASVDLDEPFTCPVCSAVRSELGRLPSWDTLDDGVGGLCNVHAWMPQGRSCGELYVRQVAAIGAMAQDLAEISGHVWLQRAMRSLGLSQPQAESIPVPLRCLVCTYQAALELALCAMVARPLCIPHLRRAVRVRGPDAIAAMRTTWRELDGLLGEYLRKEDYRFRSEPRGIEQKSPRWVVALLSAAPGIR